LGERDIAPAREHFSAAVATKALVVEYHIARAELQRLS
jgi:hypothetical protein